MSAKATYSVLTVTENHQRIPIRTVRTVSNLSRTDAHHTAKYNCEMYRSEITLGETGETLRIDHYAVRNDATGKVVARYYRDWDSKQQRIRGVRR